MGTKSPKNVQQPHALLARLLLDIDKQVDIDLLAGEEWWWHNDEDGAWKALNDVCRAVKRASGVACRLPESRLMAKVNIVLKQVDHMLAKAKSFNGGGTDLAVAIQHGFRAVYAEHGDTLRRLAAELEEAGDEAARSSGSSDVVHKLEADQQKTGPKANGPGQPGGTVGTKESGSAANTVNIQNSNVIMGDVHHPENLVLGDHGSIRQETPISQKNKKNIKRTITAFVVFLAALLTVLQIFFGWIGIISRFLKGE
jgi:hypothetical protein